MNLQAGRHHFRSKPSYSFALKDCNCTIEFFVALFMVKESETKDKSGTNKETLPLDLIGIQSFHESLVTVKMADVFEPNLWGCIAKLTQLLEVFKDATTILSGVYYPTSCLTLTQLYLMCTKINGFEFEGEVYEKMVAPMKEKFIKYFEEMPPTITCAAALNPCLNVAGVELLLTNIISDLGLDEDDPNFTRNAITSFHNSLTNLFDVYQQKYGSSLTVFTPMSQVGSSSSSRQDLELNLFNSLRNENSKRARGSTTSSELGRYQSTDFIMAMTPEQYKTFDILAWWKEREQQFPVCAAMARDLLSVQASTVASESAFSFSGRVLLIKRTRLTPEAMEMAICLRDYLDGAERTQHINNLEGETEMEEHVYNYEVLKGVAQPLSDEEAAYDESVRSTPTT